MLEGAAINPVEVAEERRAHSEREFGFWLYLMSDAIIFALLFATYLIMVESTAAGPSARDIFHLGSRLSRIPAAPVEQRRTSS